LTSEYWLEGPEIDPLPRVLLVKPW
jgi:hypothetical protein